MRASFSQPPQKQKNAKSGYLPYFKRFPNNRYLSQQKKRGIFKLDNSPKNEQQSRFFSQISQRIHDNPTIIDNSQRVDSISIINNKEERIRPRPFVRQIAHRMGSIRRRKTQEMTPIKFSVGRSKQFNANNLNNGLEGTKIMRGQKRSQLTEFEKLQIQNYQEIYYCGQNCKSKIKTLAEMKKEDGGYLWVKGDHISYRYQIIDQLGQGSFGQVFKCYDHKLKMLCAVKLVKDNEKYTKQSKTEIKILNLVKSKDYQNNKNCIHIKDFFMFRFRMCMVFDLLWINLYELTKNNGYHGFPLDLTRRFVLQILNAIHFLHTNSIIHADLKPQNILLKEENKSGLKIIDFGSSCFENETIYTYIQSRYYRAPQVIFGMPYNHKIDIWSFGCIIAELHLGYPIFAGEDESQQIRLIIQTLGNPPQSLSHNSKRWDVFFDQNNQLLDKSKIDIVPKPLNQALQNPQKQFVEFIRQCLQWDPQKRPNALTLLKNQWVIKGLPQQIRQQHLNYVKQQEKKSYENVNEFKKNKKYSFSIRERHRLF